MNPNFRPRPFNNNFNQYNRGGFSTPFFLGGLTGGLVAPLFYGGYNRPYYPTYYSSYYVPYPYYR